MTLGITAVYSLRHGLEWAVLVALELGQQKALTATETRFPSDNQSGCSLSEKVCFPQRAHVYVMLVQKCWGPFWK